jgi:photosystem II stability/assembly factor-like uncharacterized protein
MNATKTISILCVSLLMIVQLSAQKFFSQEPGHQPASLKEMQIQFDAWSKKTNLKTTRNWKYYKRWENEMQYHTDSTGEPAQPGIFIKEALKYTESRKVRSSQNFSAFSWTPVGPNTVPNNETGYMQNGIGRINCIAFHPSDPNTYFVGVAQGGLWKTTNNGASWTPLTDNLPITRISDICIDPGNPNTMYISLCDFEYIDFNLMVGGAKRNTSSGLGVYKTTDGGNTWAPTALTFQLSNGDASLIRRVLVNPVNSNKVVAAGVSGMYLSLNGGTSWTKTLDSLFWDVQQDPLNPNTLYAASGWLAGTGLGHAGIYKSTDFGTSWSLLNTGIPTQGSVQRLRIAIAPTDNNFIYAVAVDQQEGLYGVYRSVNAGLTWTFLPPALNVFDGGTGGSAGGQGTYDLGCTVDATNKGTLYVGGVNLYASLDSGQTFNPAAYWMLQYGPTIHGDIHFIATNPLTKDVFVCSDGGVYRTPKIIPQSWSAANATPWATQWTHISDGMQISSLYRISSSKTLSGQLLAGAQDNGSMYFDGSSWNTIFGGDGMDNWIDPVNNQNLVGSAQYGSFMMSSNGGLSSFGISPNPNNENSEWTTPLTADYNVPGTLYAGFQNVTTSNDGGNNWSMLTALPDPNFHSNELSALAVSYSNSSVLYAAKRVRYEFNTNGTVYVSKNGGGSWTNITAGLPPALYYTSVEVSQKDENTAYVGIAGFSAGFKVFQTKDAGSTWQNISYNLPNIPVNCIKTVPGNDSVLIATDLGLYLLNKSTNTWLSVSQGLPNVIVSDIEFNPALKKIYVCTFGRGVWESDMGTLGIPNNATAEIGVSLFPSPNTGTFTIQISDQKITNETFQLEIIDITGRLVYSSTLAGQSSYPMKLNLLPGMYFAKIKSGKHSGVKSFTVN